MAVDEVDGWTTEGFPIKKPRLGWIATKAKDSFHTEVTSTQLPIKYVTMMSMYSYGSKWAGSTLNLTIELHRKGDAFPTNVTSHLVKGYHSDKTSIIVGHTFEVPEGGAEIGDKVRTNFVLVGGSTFRIQGLLYCFSK